MMLEVVAISKDFAGNPVLREVSFSAGTNELIALVGSNGAGKSSLLKILAGVYSPNGGHVRLNGERLELSSPRDALRAGIGMIHQDGALIPAWRVSDHLDMAAGLVRGPMKRGNVAETATASTLARLAPQISPFSRIEDLSQSERQLVEVARVLHGSPRVLLADEPTAGLAGDAKARVVALLREAASRDGLALMVTHDLKLALKRADRVIVLRDGQVTLDESTQTVTLDELLAAMGGPPQRPESARSAAGERLLLRIDGTLLVKGRLSDVLNVRAGSILGLTGATDSPARDLLRRMVGLAPNAGLDVALGGERVPCRVAATARAGLAYVSRERTREWNFIGQSVRFNLTAGVLMQLSRFGYIAAAREHAAADRLRRRFGIQIGSLSQPIEELSGGNRQKTVLARAMSTNPRALLLDEPFSGVDTFTRLVIINELKDFARAGGAAVIFSQEVTDLLAACEEIRFIWSDGQVRTVDATTVGSDAIEALIGEDHA